MRKRAMNSIKRFSDQGDKEEIRGNTEAQFWNGLILEFAHGFAINILEPISEGIW
jgi:hypothetical protein